MPKYYRLSLVLALLLIATPAGLLAQESGDPPRVPARTGESPQLIKSTLDAVAAIIREITFQGDETTPFTERLRQITSQMTQATQLATPVATDRTASANMDDLARLLQDILGQVETLRDELDDEGEYDLAYRLAPIERDLKEAVDLTDRLNTPDYSTLARAEAPRWQRPQPTRALRGNRRTLRDEDEDEPRIIVDIPRREVWIREDLPIDLEELEDPEGLDEDDWRWRRHKGWRSSSQGWRGRAGTFVGDYWYRWPYGRDTGLYRSTPAIRHNRVEGLVLGVGHRPMEWDDYDWGRIYGQLGYAFALDEVRYQVGAEARLDRRYYSDFGIKVGGSYQRNTATKDSWKVSWLENSLASFFFENDFLDYYEVEGWSLYAVQRLTPFVQFSLGYRSDEYRSLEKNTSWSLFDGGSFPLNPAIDEGQMSSLIFALEGGQVQRLRDLPRGGAFRLEAEIGQGLGGDFSFNRYVADARAYMRPTRHSSFGLRLRGGLATGDDGLPIQKTFALGGLGSMRAYSQNGFIGTRMLLANAEYAIEQFDIFDDVLEDLLLIGLFDAGWVNTFGTDAFRLDDVMPSAGFGIGFDDRTVRLEIAWPLRDFGDGHKPTVWLRVTPNF